jgi:hypothetical protein
MQESYTVEERYRDLVERAESYFRRVFQTGHGHSGMRRWLEDCRRTHDLEAVEVYRERAEFARMMRDGEGLDDDVIDVD